MIGLAAAARSGKATARDSGFHGSPVEAKCAGWRDRGVGPARHAVGHQGADQGRRDAQMGDAVALDHAPQPVHVREIGRTVVEDHARPVEQRSEDQPRPHHPAHVGHPVDGVAGVGIGAEGHILSGLDREAAVGVDRALGSPGGAAGVDDHEHVFGSRRLGLGFVRLVGDQILPPDVPAIGPRRVGQPDTIHDDHVFEAGDLGGGFVGHGLHGHGLAPAESPVHGEEGLGVGVGQAGDHGADSIAAEKGQDHAADLDDGQKGHGQFGDHGHVEAHGIPFAQAQGAQTIGAFVDLPVQVAVGQVDHGALLAFPAQGHPVTVGGVGLVFVQAVVDDVHLPVHAPAGHWMPSLRSTTWV